MKYSNYRKGQSQTTRRATSYYSAGMRSFKEKNYKMAIMFLKNAIDIEPYYRAVFTLGKCYQKMGQHEEAQIAFERVLALEPDDIYARKELIEYYMRQDRKKEAEFLLKEWARLKPNEVYPKIRLGNLYIDKGREAEAEQLFKKCIELKPTGLRARKELGRLYALQGKMQESKEMYDYVISKIRKEVYNQTDRKKHVMKHLQDDKSKDVHGVFNKNPLEILENINWNNAKKYVGNMADVYCIRVENCGYEGGSKGDGHQLDYMTIMTLPNSKDIITVFPSDKLKTIKRTSEQQYELKFKIKHKLSKEKLWDNIREMSLEMSKNEESAKENKNETKQGSIKEKIDEMFPESEIAKWEKQITKPELSIAEKLDLMFPDVDDDGER